MANVAEHMKYDYLTALRGKNAAWRLLASAQASFVVAFFYREFLAQHRTAIAEQDLIVSLEEFIAETDGNCGEIWARTAKEYLGIWADAEHSWLRKFFVKDEPHYDLTASAQKAVEWLYGLRPQAFIGTESRLRTVFDLLHEIASESDDNPQYRLALLEEEKALLEKKIAAVKQGKVEVLDDVQIRERFMQASAMAQAILADFREVEENFRHLERAMIDKIVTWTQGKGELLSEIFAEREGIQQSEQGRSFAAFWNFLMLSSQQEDFRDELAKVLQLACLKDLSAEMDLSKIHRDWIAAASKVQGTIALLSKQIRRYVDEEYLREEQRIFALIQGVEGKAVTMRDRMPKDTFMEIDKLTPTFSFMMDRPLFVPPKQSKFEDKKLEQGLGNGAVHKLFEQVYVDKQELENNIEAMLLFKQTVTLVEVIQQYPLKHGLAEVLMYMLLASKRQQACFAEGELEEILLNITDGKQIMAVLQKVTFMKRAGR